MTPLDQASVERVGKILISQLGGLQKLQSLNH